MSMRISKISEPPIMKKSIRVLLVHQALLHAFCSSGIGFVGLGFTGVIFKIMSGLKTSA